MSSSTPAPESAPACAYVPQDDARWFREELQPHDAAVRGYLKHRYPTVDMDDVMQESYIKILRAKATGRINSSKAFFFTVVRNTALSLLRKRKTYTETPLSEVPYLRVLDGGPDAAEFAENNLRLDLMQAAIEHLPPRCREVMRLATLRGKSNAEIARDLGIADNTVKTQLAIGIKRCSDYVRERGGIT